MDAWGDISQIFICESGAGRWGRCESGTGSSLPVPPLTHRHITGLVFRGACLTGFLSHSSHQKLLGENPLFPVQMHAVDLPAVPQWVTDVLSLPLFGDNRSCSCNSSALAVCALTVIFFNCRLHKVILVPVFILSDSSYWSVTKVKIHGLIHHINMLIDIYCCESKGINCIEAVAFFCILFYWSKKLSWAALS